MSKQTTQGFNFTGEMFTASVKPLQELPFSLCFKNGAKLTLNPGGSATFEGDADEAAQMFFDGVVKLHNFQYQKLEAAEKRIAELEARAVKLPAAWWVKQGGQSLLAYEKQMLLDALAAAGISVAVERN